jgi:hypothetical protein
VSANARTSVADGIRAAVALVAVAALAGVCTAAAAAPVVASVALLWNAIVN